jgi:hypothetical protein
MAFSSQIKATGRAVIIPNGVGSDLVPNSISPLRPEIGRRLRVKPKEAANRWPYFLAVLTGVLVSSTLPHLWHMKMCETTCSAATRVDLDHAISTLQPRHIGVASCSIDLLSISI